MTEVNDRFDVAIVGAGLVGSLMADRLSRQQGLSVLLIDAGDTLYFDPQSGADRRQPLLDRFYEAPYKTPNSPYPNLPWAPSPDETALNRYYVTMGPLPFQSTYTRIVGGTTYHWLGLCPRFDPASFREQTLYGVNVDWPLQYDDLDPWYFDAEREMGVAGDMSLQGQIGIPPRSRPFPLPPIPQSYSDKVAAQAVSGLVWRDRDSDEAFPISITSTPSARNSVPYQGRPACSGSANCIPICPTGAKYDATVPLKRALGIGGEAAPSGRKPVVLLRRAVLQEVVLQDGASGDDQPPVKELLIRRGPSHDDDLIVRAKAYVLAIHAMETPKILLSSRRHRQDGVANRSGCVGRYLMDHDIAISNARLNQPMWVYRGPRITSSIESVRDGRFRSHRAAFRPELSNVGTSWETGAPQSNVVNRVRQGLTGRALREAVAWDSQAVLHIDAMIEPRALRESYVRPSDTLTDAWGLPRPQIHYCVDEYSQRGRQAFFDLVKQIYYRLGATDADITTYPGWYGAGHVMGTTRMGDDPRTSVTDSYGRTHDHPNLYLVGAGLFPTVSTVNPTLTLAALALRTAARLRQQLLG